MAALALGSALEAMMYAYFIIWSGDDGKDPSKDGKIPGDLVLFDLIEAAKQVDLLSSVKFKDKFGEHAVEEVITEIRHMRNNVHAGVALRKNFNPAKFKKKVHAAAGHLRRRTRQLQPKSIGASDGGLCLYATMPNGKYGSVLGFSMWGVCLTLDCLMRDAASSCAPTTERNEAVFEVSVDEFLAQPLLPLSKL